MPCALCGGWAYRHKWNSEQRASPDPQWKCYYEDGQHPGRFWYATCSPSCEVNAAPGSTGRCARCGRITCFCVCHHLHEAGGAAQAGEQGPVASASSVDVHPPPPLPADGVGSCSLCSRVLHWPWWASMLTCEVCRLPACVACLEPDAATEDGPVELICLPCRRARRQECLTAELEADFQDLRNPQFDEALVVELSDIVGCSQAEANALLIWHEGNLERAVRSYIASEGRNSVVFE